MSEIESNKKPYNLALASVILAFIFVSLPAIICGHIALKKINQKRHIYSTTDKRMAIGGLIVGYTGMLGWLYICLIACAAYFRWDLSFMFPFGVKI